MPNNQYVLMGVSFDFCNSLAYFQEFTNAVFQELIASAVILAYMDGLITPSVDSL